MAASAHIQIQIIILHVPKDVMFPFIQAFTEILFQVFVKKHLKYVFIFLNIYLIAISFDWIITNCITEVLLR